MSVYVYVCTTKAVDRWKIRERERERDDDGTSAEEEGEKEYAIVFVRVMYAC